jgi:putative tricarboxylic transport membrane protein
MSAPPALRPSLAICGSVIAFALLIERAGLPLAVLITVLIASAGTRQLSVRHAFVLALVVAAAMTVVFIAVLDQPFGLLPWV